MSHIELLEPRMGDFPGKFEGPGNRKNPEEPKRELTFKEKLDAVDNLHSALHFKKLTEENLIEYAKGDLNNTVFIEHMGSIIEKSDELLEKMDEKQKEDTKDLQKEIRGYLFEIGVKNYSGKKKYS